MSVAATLHCRCAFRSDGGLDGSFSRDKAGLAALFSWAACLLQGMNDLLDYWSLSFSCWAAERLHAASADLDFALLSGLVCVPSLDWDLCTVGLAPPHPPSSTARDRDMSCKKHHFAYQRRSCNPALLSRQVMFVEGCVCSENPVAGNIFCSQSPAARPKSRRSCPLSRSLKILALPLLRAEAMSMWDVCWQGDGSADPLLEA